MKGFLSGKFREYAMWGLATLTLLGGSANLLRGQHGPRAAEDDIEAERTAFVVKRTVDDPEHNRIYGLMETIANKGGPDARALVDFFDDSGVAFKFDELTDEIMPGFYHVEEDEMHLSTDKSDDFLMALLVHEMVHAWQDENGVLLHMDYKQDVHYTLAMTIAAEAGAQAFATQIAHRLKEAGHPGVWDEFKSRMGMYDDMMDRFETALEHARLAGKDADEAYELATEAAWHQYFKGDDRRDSYNMLTFTGMVIAMAEEMDETEDAAEAEGRHVLATLASDAYAQKYLTEEEARDMAELPGGSNFARRGRLMSEDSLFSETVEGRLLRTAAAAFEAQRLGNNEAYDFSDENLDKYGLFAGLDFRDVAWQLMNNDNAEGNILRAMAISAVELDVHTLYRDYLERVPAEDRNAETEAAFSIFMDQPDADTQSESERPDGQPPRPQRDRAR